MVVWMASRISPSAAAAPAAVPGLVAGFKEGEAMGKRLGSVKFRNKRGGIHGSVGVRRGFSVRMAVATTDVVEGVKVEDLDLEKRNMRTVMAVILGGGAGTRLFPLTRRRAKPAVSMKNKKLFSVS